MVNSELLREGLQGFGFFSVTPLGLVILLLGIIYMLLMRFMLKGEEEGVLREGWRHRTFRDLIKEYHLTGRARRPGYPSQFADDWPAS